MSFLAINLPEGWVQAGQFLVGLFVLIVAVGTGCHAVLYKRDSRAAVFWVGLIALVPLLGALLYFGFGINRIRRRAALLRGGRSRFRTTPETALSQETALTDSLAPEARHLGALARVVRGIYDRPLVAGNRIEVLVNGDEAYPAMLEAINQARRSITLASYIFDRDDAGLAFAEALGRAVERGVEVRVLIDATGSRYSWPSILGELRWRGVRHARFLPVFPSWRVFSFNLRNHRKLLVVDGISGFTGGMNIRLGHWLARQPSHPVQDLHFRITGPVVAHLQEVFADDWYFTTEESLRGEAWFPAIPSGGAAIARGIEDGPDEDLDQLRWTILGALSIARKSVQILTPYFLPDPPIITALNLAAMRGVAVDIILPSKSNLPFVQWASAAHWWQVLEHGCRIHLTPAPFDHSKLLVIDDYWSLVGSTNWDPRSLRLNFEFDVEAYDPTLAQRLKEIFEAKLKLARPVTLEEMDGRGLLVKLRDGVARLFTPLL